MLTIQQGQIDALGFDLARAVTQFTIAKAAHHDTIDIPAPAAHPVVERVYRNGGMSAVTILPDPPEPKPPEPKPTELNAAMVNAEAARRIEEAFPASSQIGVLATMLDHIRTNGQPDPMTWKPDQQAAYIKAATLWGWTKAVHAAAAAVVAMTPIPVDYTNDAYWPKVPV